MRYSYKHMCKRSVSKTEYDIEAINELVDDGFEKQALVEYSSLLEDLEQFDEWCSKHNKTDFFQYFQDALIGAYYRYVKTKKKAWSKKTNRIIIICSALLSAISASALPVIKFLVELWQSGNSIFPDDKNYMLILGSVASIMIVLVSVGCLIMYVYRELHNKRNYYETWVRHSVCHSRLRFALSAFLVSDRTDENYENLVSSTFTILERNVDQFALNLSAHGIASHEKR